jgi:hypothetical protein
LQLPSRFNLRPGRRTFSIPCSRRHLRILSFYRRSRRSWYQCSCRAMLCRTNRIHRCTERHWRMLQHCSCRQTSQLSKEVSRSRNSSLTIPTLLLPRLSWWAQDWPMRTTTQLASLLRHTRQSNLQ